MKIIYAGNLYSYILRYTWYPVLLLINIYMKVLFGFEYFFNCLMKKDEGLYQYKRKNDMLI